MTEAKQSMAPHPPPVHDDLTAPTIVVDGIAGALGTNGMITFGCVQSVLEVSGVAEMVPKRKMVLRLAIPIGAFPGIATFFQKQLETMIAEGMAIPGAEKDVNDGSDA